MDVKIQQTFKWMWIISVGAQEKIDVPTVHIELKVNLPVSCRIGRTPKHATTSQTRLFNRGASVASVCAAACLKSQVSGISTAQRTCA